MATSAKAGAGLALSISNMASPPVFTAVPEILNLSWTDRQRETIDVTNMDSEDLYREFIKGFKVGGTVSFGLNFTESAAYTAFDTEYEDDDKAYNDFKITHPSWTKQWEFAGIIETFGPIDATPDSQLKATCTVKITGKPEFVTP
jgi:predicted secreted protein